MEQSTPLLAQINALPSNWHRSGSVGPRVLAELERRLAGAGVQHSVETGCGRTTLLLSHLSARHVVFVRDDEQGSLRAVRESPLLNTSAIEIIEGPTQKTIVRRDFDGDPIDLAFLDGPHAYPFPDLEYWAVYSHLRLGGLLVIDDIQIPTIANLFRFLRADDMFALDKVIDDTAFFTRTTAPVLDPYSEGWWEQAYNQRPTYAHRPPWGRARKFVAQRLPPKVKARLKALR